MSEKPKETEIETEIETETEKPKEIPKKEKPKKVNIMATDDSHEPPKKAEKTQDLDLSPIIDEIKSGFAALIPKETPKPETKKETDDFLSVLGNW